MTKNIHKTQTSSNTKTNAELMSEQIDKIIKDSSTDTKINEDIELCIKKYHNANRALVSTIVKKVSENLNSYFDDVNPNNTYGKWVRKIRNIGCGLDKEYSIKNLSDEERAAFENKAESFKQFFSLAKGDKIEVGNLLKISITKESKIYPKLAKDFARHKAKEIALKIYDNLPEDYKTEVRNWDNVLDFENSESLDFLARKTSLTTNSNRLAAEERTIQVDTKNKGKQPKRNKVTINNEVEIKIMSQEGEYDTDSTETYSPPNDITSLDQDLPTQPSLKKAKASSLSESVGKNNQSHGH